MKRPVFFFIYVSLIVSIGGAGVLTINAQTELKSEAAVIEFAGKQRSIRHSDLMLQMALQPQTPLDPPKAEDLKRVLEIMINLTLISLELESSRAACRLATEAEIADEIKRVTQNFSSPVELETRLRLVGFDSMRDTEFYNLMSGMTWVKKCLDFRFRSFVIVTAEEAENYYRKVFAPEFRRRNPGLLLPDLQQQGPQIRQILTEQKAATEIQKFLDHARSRAKIIIK